MEGDRREKGREGTRKSYKQTHAHIVMARERDIHYRLFIPTMR